MSIPKSAKLYCCEDISLIENYQEALESNEIYDIHHKLETSEGVYISKNELVKNNLYYSRPASELIFLPHSEHTKLHHEITIPGRFEKLSQKRKGHAVSEETKEKIKQSRLEHNANLTEEEWKKEYARTDETKRKISIANKGRKHAPVSEDVRKKLSKSLKERWENPEYKKRLSESISEGVKRTYTDEHRKRISESAKNRIYTDVQRERCRQNMLGKKWWTNGIDSVQSHECPEGYWRGRTVNCNINNKGSKDFHWYTNGITNISAKECPEGFWKGRISSKCSEETKRKMSESRKGEKNGFYGKKHSEETRIKIGARCKGTHWYTNGIDSVQSHECPEGFWNGRTKK